MSSKGSNQNRQSLSTEEWKDLIKHAGLDAAKVAGGGMGARILMNVLVGLSSTLKDKHPFTTQLYSFLFGKSVRRTGTLLGGLVFTYKVLLETLPRYTSLSPKQSDFIAGALSGLWILAESASVRTVYGVGVASRAVQGLLRLANEKQTLSVPKGTEILFSLSAAQIFFSFVAHPLAFSPVKLKSMLEKTGVSYEAIRNNLEILKGNSLDKYSFIHSHLLNQIDPNNLAKLFMLNEQPSLIPCASIHPLHYSCFTNIFSNIFKGVKQNFPFYFAMNLFPNVVFKRKSFLKDPLPKLKKAFKSTLRSGFALGLFIFLLQSQLCGTRNFFSNSKFLSHRYIYYFQALLAAFAAIQFENQGRKGELCLIFTTQAVETLYKVLRMKGLLPKVPHFESVLFAVGTGIFMTLIRHEPDSLDSFDHRIATKFLKLKGVNEPEPDSVDIDDDDEDDGERRKPKDRSAPNQTQTQTPRGQPSTTNSLSDSQHTVDSNKTDDDKFESIGEKDLSSSQESAPQPQSNPSGKKGKKKEKKSQQTDQSQDLSESVQSID